MIEPELQNPKPKNSTALWRGLGACGITFMMTALGSIAGGLIALVNLGPLPPRQGEVDGLLYVIAWVFAAGGVLVHLLIGAAGGGVLGLIAGILISIKFGRGIRAPMKPDSPDSSKPISLAPSICLGVVAVLSCGVPFVPPLVFFAVPLAGVGLVLVARCVRRETHWSKGRVFNTAVALALNGFALYLALGRHHLIDWLEGH